MTAHKSRSQFHLGSLPPARLSSKAMCHVLLLSLLASCANDPTHQLGMKQVKEGPVDQGVANLKKASASKPDNIPYRADYLREKEKVINQLIVEADRAYSTKQFDDAEAKYHQILEIDQDNAQAKSGLLLVARARQHNDGILHATEAMESGNYEEARLAIQPVLLEDPRNQQANKLLTQIDEARFNGHLSIPLPDLNSNFKKPVSLQFRDANLKMVLEALSKSSGLNILLDKDLKGDLKTTIFVKDASVEDVISLILMQNQLEKKVINDKTIYIYPNTAAKIKDYQDLVVRTFQLTNADAKQMQTMLKTVLKCNDVYVNERNNALVMRDTPDVIELAAKMLAAQDQDEPEVMLEVEVLEVSLKNLSNIGAKYPGALTFTPLKGSTGSLTLQSLQSINKSNIGLSDLSLTMNLMQQDSDTNLLASPRIRVKQNEKAKIHIGDKVPVFQASVTPSGSSAITSGTVQYLEVGLKLEVEPQVHMDGEVTIKTSLEVSDVVGAAQSNNAGTTAYQIGTRVASTVLRLADGETQVLAGLIRNSDTKTADKVPGLGSIPLIGRLFSSNNTDKEKREIILSITPHIIRNQHHPDANLSTYWSGTGSAVKTRPVTVEQVDTLKIESTGATVLTSPAPAALPAVVAPTPSKVESPTDQAKPSTDASVDAPKPLVPASPPTLIRPATAVRPDIPPITAKPANATTNSLVPAPRTAVQSTDASASGGMTDATVPATPR